MNALKTVLAGSCAMALVAAPAYAHHPAAPGTASAGGGINTLTASTLPEKEFVAGIQYDYAELDTLSDETLEEGVEDAFLEGDTEAHLHSMQSISTVSLTGAYGVTDDFTISLRLPFVARQGLREAHTHEETPGVPHGEIHQLGDASGIGDLSVLAQYRFLNDAASGLELAGFAGFEAPTGKDDELSDDGELLDSEFQPGSNSWDLILGLAASKRLNGWSLHASGLYTIAGDNDDDVNLGDRFNYGVAASFRLFGEEAHDHAPGTAAHNDDASIDGIMELNGEWHDRQKEGSETEKDSGGHVLYISPGIRLSDANFSAFASVGIPVSSSMNGIQDDPDIRATAGVAWRF